MAKKMYDDGLSPQARFYRRNREAILKKRAEYTAANKEHCAALRHARKDKSNAQKVEYRKKNKERIDKYFAENRERFLANKKIKYDLNKDNILEARRKRYAEDKGYADAIKEKVKAYNDANPEKHRARSREWTASNPEKVRIQSSAKRARKRNATGIISSDIAAKLLLLQKGKCPVCRVSLADAGYHIDHINPLSKGGAHDDNNIQLLCPPCNLSKHAKHPVDFMQSRGFLL